MSLVRTTLIGIDKDGARVYRLRSGNYIGGLFADAADVDAYVKKHPQQQGMDPALYRRQYGPITPERELLVRENQQLRDSVARGLAESAQGDVMDLGNFSQYAEDLPGD